MLITTYGQGMSLWVAVEGVRTGTYLAEKHGVVSVQRQVKRDLIGRGLRVEENMHHSGVSCLS